MPRSAAGRQRARYAGFALSTLWHLAFLSALLTFVARPFVVRTQSGIDVSLVRPPFFIPSLRRKETPVTGKAGVAPTRAPQAFNLLPPVAVAPPTAAPSAQNGQTPSSDKDVDARVRGVLRGALGCANASIHLSEDENQRCSERAEAHAREAAPMPLAQVDPRKLTYYDAIENAYNSPGGGPASRGVRPGILGAGVSCGFGPGQVQCKPLTPQGFLTEELGIEPP